EIVALNVNGKIPQAAAAVDCQQRVATTLESITRACGYAKDCTCELVIPPVGDATFDRDVCDEPCVPNQVDGSCADFNPVGFLQCVMTNGSAAPRKALFPPPPGGEPTPLATPPSASPPHPSPPSPLPSLALGPGSRCDVEGPSHIKVGGREPTH